MDSTLDLLLVAGIVFPGLWEYWAGRGLLRERARATAAATASERWLKHRRRGVTITILSIVLVTVMGGQRPMAWLCALPLVLLSQAMGRYPSTKALVGGDWSFGTYMKHVIRFGLALQFSWVFIILVPAAMASAATAERTWLTASVLIVVWLLWSWRTSRWMSALMASVTITDGVLSARFAAVAAKAKVKAPLVLRAETPRGLWPNACALVSSREQRVIMGSTLLDTLAPDEAAAIFAHEMAHIEHFQGRVVLRVRLIMWTAFVLGVATLPVLSYFKVQSVYTSLALLWLNLVFIGLARKTMGGKKHEGESDVRAVQLCGDAEALIRGLTKLHELNSLPRRWDRKFDDTASHPSLARRLQAIRAAAGLVTPPPTTDAIVRGKAAGTFVVFSPTGLALLDGVPAAVAPEVGRLKSAAAMQRSWAYTKLTHLCVATESRDVHALEIGDVDGATLRVPVAAESLSVLQAQLDLVDGMLAPRPSTAQQWSKTMLAIAAFTLLLLWTPYRIVPGALILLAFLSLWRPVFPLLLAVGAGALAACALTAVGWLWHGSPSMPWLQVPWVAGAGLVFTAAAVQRRREPRFTWTRERRTVLGAAVAILAISTIRTLLLGSPQPLVGTAAGSGAAAIALGILVATTASPSAWLRAAAVLLGALGLFPMLRESGWYQSKQSHDPFAASAPSVTWQALGPGEDWPSIAGLRIRDVELALSGDAVLFALEKAGNAATPQAETGDEDDGDADEGRADDLPGAAASTFLWLHRDGRRCQVEGEDARLLDAGHVVLLRSSNQGLRLESIDVLAPSTPAVWALDLPAVRLPHLVVDPQTLTWRVSGPAYPRPQWYQGTIGKSNYETISLNLSATGRFAPAGVGGGGLSVAPRRGQPFLGSLTPLLWLLAERPETRVELRQVEANGSVGQPLLETNTWLLCDGALLGTRRFLCQRAGRENASLWWVDLGHGSLHASPIADIGGGYVWSRKSAPNGTVTWVDATGVSWLDPARRLGTRLSPVALGRAKGARIHGAVVSAVSPSRLAVAARKQGTWRLTVWPTP